LIAVGRVESQAARGEPVDIRRLCEIVALAAQQRFEVVDADQQHIGSLGGERLDTERDGEGK